MTLQRKNQILEVSIESDILFKPDHFMNAKHESQSCSFIIHDIHNPEWAARTLRNVRNVKNVVDMGEAKIDESTTLHMIKVLYDSDRLSKQDAEQFEAFMRMIRNAITSSGVSHTSHL
jgi:predicted RNA-binding protein with PUA-like domain